MFQTLLLSFILLNLSPFAYSDDLTDSVKLMNTALTSAGTVDYRTNCATCAQSAQISNTALLESKANNQKINLSIISEDQARDLFIYLKSQADIPYGFLQDGSYARSHKMVRLLDSKGITAGKAFIEGKLYVDSDFGEVGLGFHVAPVILVRTQGKILPYIFDPSLFEAPVPYEAWKGKLLSKSKSSSTTQYYTNRFAYDTADKASHYDGYQEEHLDDMLSTNRENLRSLFTLQQKKSRQGT